MRTYGKRKPEYLVIEDIDKICRLCLNNCEDSVPIFKNMDSYSSLSTRIMLCVGLEVTREENLPNMICSKCHTEIESCYKFRKMCEVAYQKLKLHLIAVKMKHFNENLSTSTEDNSLSIKKSRIEKINLSPNIVPCQELAQLSVKNVKSMKNVRSAEDINNQSLFIDNEKSEDLLASSKERNFMIVENEELKTKDQKTNEDNSIADYEILQIKDGGPINIIPHTSNNELISQLQDKKEAEVSSYILQELLHTQVLSVDNDNLVLPDEKNTMIELITDDGSVVNLMLEEVDGEQLDELDASNSKKGQRWECGDCGKRYSRRWTLRRHAVAHGARPRCSTCARVCASRDVLRRHQLVHRAKRPFPCSSCPKSFTQRAALVSHRRAHERALTLHACPHCTKVFLHPSSVSRHIRSHSSTRLSCSVCARPFTDASSLKRHARTTHGGDGVVREREEAYK